MRRKVIQLAGKTLVVSLPSKWAKKYNVKKGDEVEVEEAENRISISTIKTSERGKKTIDIANLDIMIKRYLGALYKSGYDEFEVHFSTVDELKTAQEVIREELIGFEVIDQRKNSIIVKRISNIEPTEFNTMMRRMFLIIISMAQDTLKALEKDDSEWLQTIVLRDKDINKIADFCRRVLNTSGAGVRKTQPAYFIAEQLEKIGDIFRDIAKHQCAASPKDRSKLSKESMRLFKEIISFFEQFYKIYFEFDMKELALFAKKRHQLKEEFSASLNKASKEETLILFYLFEALEITFDMNGPLMAMHL